jgi:hypothetical protein
MASSGTGLDFSIRRRRPSSLVQVSSDPGTAQLQRFPHWIGFKGSPNGPSSAWKRYSLFLTRKA